MTLNPAGRARLYLLKALGLLVEAREMFLPKTARAEQVKSLEGVDDLLTNLLSKLSRTGLVERKECFDQLDEARAALERFMNQWASDQKSLLREMLALVQSYLDTFQKELKYIPDRPEEPPSNGEGNGKDNGQATGKATGSQRPLEHLISEREEQVIKLAAQGFTQEEIAGRLQLSVSTVRAHYEHVLTKLKCRNMTQAVAVYVAAESEEYV